MAVELCSENCGVSVSPGSPRISFSHDFSQSDAIPVEQHPFRSKSSGLSSSFDFDFPVSESLLLDESSSSAEELFSDGRIRILPSSDHHQVKSKKNQPLKQTSTQSPPPLPPPHSDSPSKSLKKAENPKLIDEVCDKQSSSSKSFWSFKRSSSCGNGYGRSLCPLPLLSRSNSTGSTCTSSVKKEGPNMKQNHQKPCSSSSSRISGPNSYQKPPLKKNYGSYGSNVTVNPILNVPSANLFGFGSIFSNTRDKSKKK